MELFLWPSSYSVHSRQSQSRAGHHLAAKSHQTTSALLRANNDNNYPSPIWSPGGRLAGNVCRPWQARRHGRVFTWITPARPSIEIACKEWPILSEVVARKTVPGTRGQPGFMRVHFIHPPALDFGPPATNASSKGLIIGTLISTWKNIFNLYVTVIKTRKRAPKAYVSTFIFKRFSQMHEERKWVDSLTIIDNLLLNYGIDDYSSLLQE